MRTFTTITITLGVLIALGLASSRAVEPGQVKSDDKKPDPQKSAVTIWILSYERRDANPLADGVFLPKLVDPALAKLKDKSAKKIAFNFDDKQVFLWFEGKQDTTLKDIEAAFGGLQLKLVAKAAFPE